MSTWWPPLSHMIPRSVPVMANFSMVLFGLSGPVTQPTSDVPGGEGGAGAAAGAGAGCAAAAGCWVAASEGVGAGATAACCWTCAERGRNALTTADVIGPSFGSGARSFAPDGLCPVGRRLDDEGRSGVSTWVAGGCAAAAAPWQGSAVAGGATPIATHNPMAVADAIDIEAIRRRGDMTHLSVGTTSL